MKAIASNGVEIQTGDAVLVRDGKNTTWSYCHFSHKKDDDSYFPYCTSFTDSMYCIPYEGNEDLTGTTNDFIVPKSVIYAEKQQKWINKHNIKVGDKVRITRKAESRENGWNACWVSSMDKNVKKTGIITTIDNHKISNIGIRVYIDGHNECWYPYHVLEKVEDKNEFRFGAKVKAEFDFMTITGILIGYCKYDNKYHIATNDADENYIGDTYWCSKIEYLD